LEQRQPEGDHQSRIERETDSAFTTLTCNERKEISIELELTSLAS
jgi:hypothetical protein